MSDSSHHEDEALSWWDERLLRIKENDPGVKSIESNGEYMQNMTNEELEELGKNIANNTHLTHVDFAHGALDDNRMQFLFRGLTGSSSTKELNMSHDGFSVAGVRSMVPFLQDANNLTRLDLGCNNIQSEGFNMLFRALRDSPIETLLCIYCGIESIVIDIEHAPKQLKYLVLQDNRINTDGCHELAKLLQGRESALELLHLQRNKIDDNGVEILVSALQGNTSPKSLCLRGNDGISNNGQTMLLRLVNDISSVEATLRSNHTLTDLNGADEQIFRLLIENATRINRNADSLEAAGREKVITTQLHSVIRANLADVQGVNHSVYSEINPLHLPEILELVGRRCGQGELYIALKSSIAGVISTVNEKQCVRAQIAYHTARLKELGNRLAVIEAAEESTVSVGNETRSIKRRREC